MVPYQALARIAFTLYKRHWRQLLFFSTCIAAGVSFLVGIESILAAVDRSVASRARELLSADVELHTYRPFDERAKRTIETLEKEGHRSADIVSFNTMLSLDNDSFLVAVKAVGKGYPFYGRLETQPPDARLAPNTCFLDESAALERELKVGDSIRLGGVKLTIAGLILKEPDRTFSGFNLAPRLLIAHETADKTGLLRFGARVRHGILIALPPEIDGSKGAQELKLRLEKELADPYTSIAAYTDADQSVGGTLERVTSFFIFLSLVALVLGTIGMTAAVSMFLNGQLETAGTLRCLGLTPKQVGRIYGALCLTIGAQGGLLGALAGWGAGALFLAPAAKRLGLAIPVSVTFNPLLIAESVILACALAYGLNAAKVNALSKISPMDALRDRSLPAPASLKGKVAIAAMSLIALFLYAFLKSNSWDAAQTFSLALTGSSIAVSLLILAALQGLAWLPIGKSTFVVRHGILSLTRHRARSLVFLFTLAMGLTLLGALGIAHRSLTSEILLGKSQSAPDIFLVDIQKSQLKGVMNILSKYAAVQAVPAPLIRARLTDLNGKPVIGRDTENMTVEQKARQRFLTREYNLTYKDELQDSERLIAGKFWEPGETKAQLSLEQSFARRVGVKLGDTLTFDVQGRPIEAQVTSIRRVDWISMRPNFFVVFPTKALEPAPQTLITSVKVGDAKKSRALRKELIKAHPNVSLVDLAKVLDNVQSVLSALLAALNVVAWLCLGVGMLVMAGTLGLGREERLRQSSLYRTLGCVSKDLFMMDLVEFVTIGAVAFLISAATSHLLGYAVAREMRVGFALDPIGLAVMAIAALALPLLAGLALRPRADAG